MQLALIFGIVIAAGAVIFALQNNIPVTVTLGLWGFDGSLAGLVSSPAVIRRQWAVSRLTRQVSDLESRLAEQEKRNLELAANLAAERATRPQPEPIDAPPEKPYFGLRTLLGGSRETPAPALDKPGSGDSTP